MKNTFLITIIVVIIDCILLTILLTQNLFTYELILIWSSIFLHILLFYSIFTNNNLLFDILHVFYVFWYAIGLTFSNVYILSMLIILLITNLVLWFVYVDCPMGKFESINETIIVHLFMNVIGNNHYVVYITIIAYFARLYYLNNKEQILAEKIETIKEENQEEL